MDVSTGLQYLPLVVTVGFRQRMPTSGHLITYPGGRGSQDNNEETVLSYPSDEEKEKC